jgi:hypothetical protein
VGELGKFDRFVETLHQQLTQPVARCGCGEPFKFLDWGMRTTRTGFRTEETDKDRGKEIDTGIPRNLALPEIPKGKPRLSGPAHAIPEQGQVRMYFVRCRADLDQ